MARHYVDEESADANARQHTHRRFPRPRAMPLIGRDCEKMRLRKMRGEHIYEGAEERDDGRDISDAADARGLPGFATPRFYHASLYTRGCRIIYSGTLRPLRPGFTSPRFMMARLLRRDH